MSMHSRSYSTSYKACVSEILSLHEILVSLVLAKVKLRRKGHLRGMKHDETSAEEGTALPSSGWKAHHDCNRANDKKNTSS